MKLSFNPRDIACIVESNLYIREVEVVKAATVFCTIRFTDHNSGIKVRGSRLFPSKEDAETGLSKKEMPKNHTGRIRRISHTITPSRTRITHLAHDYSHLAHDFKVDRDGILAVNG